MRDTVFAIILGALISVQITIIYFFNEHTKSAYEMFGAVAKVNMQQQDAILESAKLLDKVVRGLGWEQ